MVYILKHQGIVFHTQLIKLLYLIDETAIKANGIPITWLDYKAWQFGPVAPETYYIKYKKSVFDSFISLYENNIGENKLLLFPKVDFDDRLIRQILRDDGVDTTLVKLFTMRYIPNVTTKDRIIYKGKEFEIYSVQNINEQNRFIRLWGREIEPTS